MYKKQRSKSKRCNSNVYCRDILLFLLLYPCIYGKWTPTSVHNYCMVFIHRIWMKSHSLPSYVYFTFISTYMHGGIIIKIIIYLCNRHYYYIFSTNIVASYTYIYFLSQFLSPFPFLFHKNISFLSYMCMNNIQSNDLNLQSFQISKNCKKKLTKKGKQIHYILFGFEQCFKAL